MNDLARVIEETEPISLNQMNETAALMEREERKYFVPAPLLAEALRRVRGLRVLQIDGMRYHRYTSIYYDTANLLFLRQHVQGRRIRHKVRIRAYASGESFLEVKGKGPRGETVKQRCGLAGAVDLGPMERQFVDDLLRARGGSGALQQVLTTTYTRVTFVMGTDRITCDLDLRFSPAARPEAAGRSLRESRGSRDVLVETKTDSSGRGFDALLRSVGIRPVSMSKYSVGMALTGREVPTNRWSRVLRRQFGHDPGGGRLNVHSLLRRNDTGVTTAIVRS